MNGTTAITSLSSNRPSSSNSALAVNNPKKSVSIFSKFGPRIPQSRGRSASPDPASRVSNTLNSSRVDPGQSNSRGTKPSRQNVNRWSHSTTSSISGLDSDLIRKRTSSSGATRRSLIGISTSSIVSPQDQMQSGRYSPRSANKRAVSSVTHMDSSRLNFQDSSNVNVVRDLSYNVAGAPADITNSKWERRTGVNKYGEPVAGVSIQYTTEAADRVPNLPNGTSLPERRSSTGNPGHRNRSANKSKDNSQTSIASAKSDQSRKGHRSPQQKDMLSKALAKANNAVLLDNAQDISGAIGAYDEACILLEQVMVRSTDHDDRRKLSAIKATYSSRIAELHLSFASLLDKALPEEPLSDEYDGQEEYFHDDSSFQSRTSKEAIPIIDLPMRQESLLPQIFGGENFLQDRTLPPVREPLRHSQLNMPMDRQYMPSPLTPRHNPTGTNADPFDVEQPILPPLPSSTENGLGDTATSWLDNFDATSSRSSSRHSENAFDRQAGRLVSDIEAEFDAAMNAAVEAAYEEPPSQEPTPRPLSASDMSPVTEMNRGLEHSSATLDDAYLDAEGEDEEQLLEEMTREFGLDNPILDHRPKPSPPIPRQSDSSGFSSKTWESSVASTTATSGSGLSPLAEAVEPIGFPPAPTQSPPKAPLRDSRPTSQLSIQPQGNEKPALRDRRMSGQSAKQLKIETFSRRESLVQNQQGAIEGSKDAVRQSKADARPFANPPTTGNPLTPLASIYSGDSNMGESPSTAGLTQMGGLEEFSNPLSSPSRLTHMMPPPPLPSSGMRKNVSSTSLRKQSLSINTTAADSADSPATPGSAIFPGETRRRPSTSTPAVSTPGANVLTAGNAGGLHLFEDHVGNPEGPVSLDISSHDPAPLEPCPESFLLRPFWLMRSLYLALSHPYGGFVTQKLFLPRELWRVRNVKIKSLEDKIATCDLLTAALQKLSAVDTLDADTVLEEMQSFEAILDQARVALSKKLGNDVGVAGMNAVFRNSPAGEDADVAGAKSVNTSSLASKSFASWGRKLRNKSSSANLSAAGPMREPASLNFTMPSLPMTTLSSVQTSRSYGRNRNPPPTPSQLPSMVAPMAAYLSSLARLFEAVQILDSIARQVEDPGLKYSSPTLVGLELSVRNAAEFFAFYVIRFVMSDLLMLVDKFMKRSTEWVMT